MKNMCNLTTVLPHNLLQTNPCIRHIRHSFHVCRCTDTGGTRPLLLQHRTISFTLLAKICKLSLCKESTFYQSVHENISESLLHSLFLHRTIQLSPFDLQSTARCPPFYKLVTSIAFSMNYNIHSHVCNIDTMMLQF